MSNKQIYFDSAIHQDTVNYGVTKQYHGSESGITDSFTPTIFRSIRSSILIKEQKVKTLTCINQQFHFLTQSPEHIKSFYSKTGELEAFLHTQNIHPWNNSLSNC